MLRSKVLSIRRVGRMEWSMTIRKLLGIAAVFFFGFSVDLSVLSAEEFNVRYPDGTTKALKGSPKWSVPLVDGPYSYPPKDGSNTNYYTSYPGHIPDNYWFKSPVSCEPFKMRVPKTHVGFYNRSNSKVGVLVQVPRGSDPSAFQAVVLGPGEFATVECEGCINVTAIVPRGAQPADDDFRAALVLGQVYESRYDGAKKRWEIAQQADR